jgi:NADPH2:quinone reductase
MTAWARTPSRLASRASAVAACWRRSATRRAKSLFLTRPRLFDYIVTTAELDESAAALFAVLASGAVKIEVGQTFPLAQARAAHEALEGRRTTGATLLIP